MIKKDSYTWKIYGWVVAVLCIVPAFLHAQEKDFTTWASAGFKYKVKPAFTLSGKLEWRTKDDLGKTLLLRSPEMGMRSFVTVVTSIISQVDNTNPPGHCN